MVAESSTSAPGSGAHLRRVFEVLFRHPFVLLVAFAVIFGSVAAWAILAAHTYRSDAKFLVQVGRETVTLDPTAVIGERTIDPRTTWESEVNSELEVLRNAELRRATVALLGADTVLGRGRGPRKEPSVLARTLDRVRDGLRVLLPSTAGPVLSDEDRAVLRLEEELDIRVVPESSVLKVSYEAPSPELAQRVLAAFTRCYLEKHRSVHHTPGALEFFTRETERAEGLLRDAEEALRARKAEAGVASVQEQRSAVLLRRGNLEQELVLTRASAESSRVLVRSLEEALASGNLPETVAIQETTTMVTPSADVLRQQLDTLKVEEQGLLADYREDSRRVHSLREKIAVASELLDRLEPVVTERVMGQNTAHSQVLVQLVTQRASASALEAKAAVLEAQMEALSGELARLDELDLEVRRLTRTIADLETRYERQKASLEQVRIDQALADQEISNIHVLQAATLPLKSERLGKTPALLLGLLLGLAGAVACAFAAEFLDQSLRTPEDVRRLLQLPVLASVRRRLLLRRLRGVAVAPLPEVSLLRDRVVGRVPLRGLVLGVTAAGRGEGVSTVAANLAAVLARRGAGSVLLVDANASTPSVHHTFATPLSPGLAERLLGGAGDLERATDVPNLRVVPAGNARKAAADVHGQRHRVEAVFDRFASEGEALLAAWKQEHAHVVLDLPAVAQLSNVAQVAAACDAVLLVVAADGNRWQVAAHARDELAAQDANVLGVVLNKRRFALPGWLYRRL